MRILLFIILFARQPRPLEMVLQYIASRLKEKKMCRSDYDYDVNTEKTKTKTYKQ